MAYGGEVDFMAVFRFVFSTWQPHPARPVVLTSSAQGFRYFFSPLLLKKHAEVLFTGLERRLDGKERKHA